MTKFHYSGKDKAFGRRFDAGGDVDGGVTDVEGAGPPASDNWLANYEEPSDGSGKSGGKGGSSTSKRRKRRKGGPDWDTTPDWTT